MRKINIICGTIKLAAKLNDSLTARKIYDALPITGQAMRWGDEVYFSIPVHAEPEQDARDVLEPGELGFWPVGNAFCIFWGPTPASFGDEPRAAGDVNVFGRISDDAAVLAAVNNGDEIRVKAL